jgi:ribosomal protein S27E
MNNTDQVVLSNVTLNFACNTCAHQFLVPSYRFAVKAGAVQYYNKADGAPIICPECGGNVAARLNLLSTRLI